MAAKVPEEKIADCRELYLRYGGAGHVRIAAEMRARGWRGFTKRNLYARTRGGRVTPGWPERFGWDREIGRQGEKEKGRRGAWEKGRRGERENGRRGEEERGNAAQSPQLPFSPTSSSPRLGVSAVKKRPSKPGSGYARRRIFASESTPLRPAAFEPLKPKFNRQKARRLRRGGNKEGFNAETQRRGEEERGNAAPSPQLPFSPTSTSQRLGDSAVQSIPDSPVSFHAWLKTMPSAWDWDLRHQLYLYEHLQRVTDGETKRLMIFMPPRHGKSELVTVRYAAYRLRRSPSTRVIISSYNQKLADNFSRKVRRVLIDDAETRRRRERETGEGETREGENGRKGEEEMRQHSLASHLPLSPTSSPQRLGGSAVNDPGSPFPFTRQRPLNRVSEWETADGGGLKAVGVGAGVTGFGADLIIVDDPVKGREEASSEVCRERLWNWFNDDLSTRLEPDGAIILIQTRWHEDDLAGRLLREAEGGGEQWTVVSLPALAEGRQETGDASQETAQDQNDEYRMMNEDQIRNEDQSSPHAVLDSSFDIHNSSFPSGLPSHVSSLSSDPLRRSPGEALWPDRFPAAYFERLRERRGEFYFASLYQQRPVPAEGGVFKREWFRYIVDQPPKGLKWKRGYDLAISTARTADYTATFRVAIDASGYLYIDGGCRRRIGFPEQKRLISHYIRTERDTEHGIETALHGRAFMQELHSDARHHGRRFRGVDARGDKLRRAGTWLTAAAEGRIRLVRGHWNRAFVDEVCSFPHGKHDDQIDAVSVAMALYDKPPATLFFLSPNNPNGEIRIAGQTRRLPNVVK